MVKGVKSARIKHMTLLIRKVKKNLECTHGKIMALTRFWSFRGASVLHFAYGNQGLQLVPFSFCSLLNA